MEVYTHSRELGLKQSIATVGIFDGMHLGHQKLIRGLLAQAEVLGIPPVVITFWPHPVFYFRQSDSPLKLLMSLEEKKLKMAELGVSNLVVLPFDQQMASTSASDFVEQILVNDLRVSHLILGDDHRFGSNREGGFEHVKQLGQQLGLEVSRMETLMIAGERVSSTLIRSKLKAGDLGAANALLGYPYYIFGEVIRGNQLGRKIGFPTANIACCHDRKQVPKDGVYAVRVSFNGEMHPGMLNIGTRPTVEESGRKSIEVHVFDMSFDLYGKNLKVHFIERIRDEMKFDHVDQLKAQLILDKQAANQILS